MEDQDTRQAQIASIANAEPIGSTLFCTHLGLLFFAATAAGFLFDKVEFLPAYALYAVLLTVEKWNASAAHAANDASAYRFVLGLLFLRSVAFSIIVLLVWRLEGDVFKFAALALIVSATINIMVFHATYRAIMACVVGPMALVFAAITLQIILLQGWSAASFGAVVVFICVIPYFALALLAAQDRWKELNATKDALGQSQRLDAIGRVASGVSHDFNNVLGVISGNLHLLETANTPHERAALLKSANEAVEGGASLSRQLLTMGKQQALMPEAVSLDAVIDTFVVFCRNVFPATISVDVGPRPEPLMIFADPNLLQSTLLNLALNAKAAMKNGGALKIDYEKAMHPTDANGHQALSFACISVSDTGHGMTQETAARAFEPFFSTKATEGGTGLGLPMVKGFVEQSRGHISLSSKEGEGTTIKLFLPLATQEQQRAIAVKSEPRAETRSPKSKNSILLVEDNREMRRILQTMMERFGYSVVGFENGDEAAAHFSAAPRDQLVLCDFDLPGIIQGDDFLKLVKSAEPNLPFILMSGFAPAEKFGDTDTLMKADLFLSKPLRLAELKDQIERLLDGT